MLVLLYFQTQGEEEHFMRWSVGIAMNGRRVVVFPPHEVTTPPLYGLSPKEVIDIIDLLGLAVDFLVVFLVHRVLFLADIRVQFRFRWHLIVEAVEGDEVFRSILTLEFGKVAPPYTGHESFGCAHK